MADVLTENDDDDIEIIEVATLPTEAEIAARTAPADQSSDEDDPDGDEEGDEDRRLSDENEDGADGASANRNKRVKRRQAQKEARDRTLREVQLLKSQNEKFERELALLKGHALDNNTAQVDQRLNDAKETVRQAEVIMARAIEAGNGDDVAAALRMRDEAKDLERELTFSKGRIEAVRTAPPAADPRVTTLAGEWMSANPWYDPKGTNEDSAITNAIDSRLVAEGYRPETPEYWEELTSRVKARLSPGTPSRKNPKDANVDAAPPRKDPPPMGSTREHVPPSTRKEVYVTPERKQAMIDAGIWEDAAKRNRMLKAYQAYDRKPAS